MKRYLLAALAVVMFVGGTTVPAVAHSDPNYTGVEDITGNGSVVVERFGRYYMTAVSHRGGALGNQVTTTRPTLATSECMPTRAPCRGHGPPTGP